jgi:hypothetical protein
LNYYTFDETTGGYSVYEGPISFPHSSEFTNPLTESSSEQIAGQHERQYAENSETQYAYQSGNDVSGG